MESNLNTDYLKKHFRWLHIGWAILGSVACALLATGKGHPPGFVFVPIAVLVWLVGHALLWLSRKLAVRGKYLRDDSGVATEKWPPALIFVAFVCGIVSIFGLFGIAWLIIDGKRLHDLLIPLAVWVPSSLCFFGILLRRDWSRILAGGGLILMAAILLYEMIASFTRGYRNSPTEWLMTIVIFTLLVLFGQYILRSSSIKAFFSQA